MRKIIAIILLFFLWSCDREDARERSQIEQLELQYGVTATVSSISSSVHMFENVRYGEASRNLLDIHYPSTSPKGVMIFFHGGSFLVGDKGNVTRLELQEIFKEIIENEIVLVSANYTFISAAESKGVLTSLEDGSEVIDFIEKQLTLLNIPSNKMILAGTSAGAGIAMWNGFKANRNAHIQGVIGIAAQSSYNLYEWEKVFPGFTLDQLKANSIELNLLFTQFYGGENPSQDDLNQLDYRNFMDKEDPPVYIFNTAGDELIGSNGELDIDVLFHSYLHADYLRAKAIDVGLDFSGIYQESPQNFSIRMLR